MKYTITFIASLFCSKAYCWNYFSIDLLTKLLSQSKIFFIILLAKGGGAEISHNKFGRPPFISAPGFHGNPTPVFLIPNHELHSFTKIIDYSCDHNHVIKAPNDEAESFLLNPNNIYNDREVGLCTILKPENKFPECKKGKRRKLKYPLDSSPVDICFSLTYSEAKEAIDIIESNPKVHEADEL